MNMLGRVVLFWIPVRDVSFRTRVSIAIDCCMYSPTRPPALQITGGGDFGDGKYKHGADVTVHGVSNVAEGLRARVIAWDPSASLYVVRDAGGQVWGLRAEKLRPLAVMELSEDWKTAHAHEAIPLGAEVRLNLQTGARLVRQGDFTPSAMSSASSRAETPEREISPMLAIASTAHDVHRKEGPPPGGANRALGGAFNSGGMSQFKVEALR